MNNFFTRVLTAIFFGVLFIVAIYFNQYTFIGLFALVTVLTLEEFYSLLLRGITTRKYYWSLFVGLCFYGIVIAYASGLIPVEILSVNLLLITTIYIFQLFQVTEKPFRIIAYKILGIIYLVVPFALFVSLGFFNTPSYNYELPLGFIFLLWANDTGAYLIGIKFGKHKLFERISPKKSWEGFFGGLIIAVAISFLIANYFHSLSLIHWTVLSVLIVIFGTMGDLVESMFKRGINVKDSGSILPGHGGLLDRFDGLFLSAPVVYVYLILFT
jgi:phosphatidate cytidylyltransferase